MHFSYFLLASIGLVQYTIADRGSAGNITPTICNNEPTNFPHTSVKSSSPSTSTANAQTSKAPATTSTASVEPSISAAQSITTTNGQTTKTPEPSTSTSQVQTSKTTKQKREESETYVPIAKRNRLDKRAGKITYSGCDSSPGSPFSLYGFKTKADVIKAAYGDAITLAGAAQNVASDNKGFTHYFGGNKPDVQLTHFKRMMAAITSSTDYYSVQFECSKTPDCKDGKSAMVTDASAGGPNDVKVIQVCQNFFSSTSTRWLLKAGESNNGPYKTEELWCAKEKVGDDSNVSAHPNNWYATAAHSIIHELTHLDALATQAGLSPADNKAQHGTDDAQSGCELSGARTFLSDYIKGETKDTSPDYNAESYAAAATEIYFMHRCGFSEIQPVAQS